MTGRVRFHVGDQAVARIAARAARRVPGVVALRADLQQTLLGIAGSWTSTAPVPPELTTDGVVAAVHGGAAEVGVTVVTRLGFRARDLAAAVRAAVADEVLATTGLPATVRVTVADIELD
ncbi:Asp23/Gls24 family envelope stress response protein [Pseudonocardia endophytica]|uniref:Putative alkaline shock family protein YloU n=1 Tax=Pseudonocardia endophytica TaxID=401976 RepID=A0A4R1HMX4_PSEEN|nr:Asp23/Gls24 family envelope stress response protein [Pseudonocardia endophytica]TCK21019.1 putative alkaline shock family protein YloU [Pseudonocardia endophytica]